MRKISANLVFPINQSPIPNGVVVVSDDGKIEEVLSSSDGLSDVEQYEGILCPGFVNAHCHLELSHLKGVLPKHTGMVSFIRNIIEARKQEQLSLTALEDADATMKENGIVAVGDICNNGSSFSVKSKSNIRYHNFIEVFGIVPGKAEEVFTAGLEIYKRSVVAGLSTSIVPHAPYTVSESLLEKIFSFGPNSIQPISIHNQESLPEDELFRKGSGSLAEFYNEIGLELDFFTPPGKSSLEWLSGLLPQGQKLLLVHNTYTKAIEMKTAIGNSADLYWCLCPNANRYIENTLPELVLFEGLEDRVVIGTDSYASNDHLSVLDEIKTMQLHKQDLPLSLLLRWGCLNGASFLGLESDLGSFEKGKYPGINLLENVDCNTSLLTDNTKVVKLV